MQKQEDRQKGDKRFPGVEHLLGIIATTWLAIGVMVTVALYLANTSPPPT